MSDAPNDARAQILGGIRRSLRRGELSGEARGAVEVTFVEDKYGRNIKTVAVADREPGDEA
jgi:hypothetical protein